MNTTQKISSVLTKGVISSFARFLSSMGLSQIFYTIYNPVSSSGGTNVLTKMNAELLYEITQVSAGTTAVSGITGIRMYIMTMNSAFFVPDIIKTAPFDISPENSYYAMFLMMLQVLSLQTRREYDNINKEMKKPKGTYDESDFDRINDEYIFNANYLTLYVIFLYHLRIQLIQNIKPILKLFAANTASLLQSIKSAKNQLGNTASKRTVLKLITTYIAPETSKFQEYIKLPDKKTNLSHMLYLVYTAGKIFHHLSQLAPSFDLTSFIAENMPTFNDPLKSANIFTDVLTVDQNYQPTNLNIVLFITDHLELLRVKVISMLTSALRLNKLIPRESYPVIDLVKLAKGDAEQTSKLVETFWFNYVNRSMFLKNMALKTVVKIGAEPTLCNYIGQGQSYQVVVPHESPNSVLKYGYEINTTRIRTMLSTMATPTSLPSDLVPTLMMAFHNDELYFVTENYHYMKGDVTLALDNLNSKSGLYMTRTHPGNPKNHDYTVTIKTHHFRGQTNTNNANNANNANNRNMYGRNYQVQHKASNTDPYIKLRTADEPATHNTPEEINKILKSNARGSNKVAPATFLLKTFTPSTDNGYLVMEMVLGNKRVMTARRIFMSDKTDADKLDDYKVDGWIIEFLGEPIAVLEHVKATDPKNSTKDKRFNESYTGIPQVPGANIVLMLLSNVMICAICKNVSKYLEHGNKAKSLEYKMKKLKSKVFSKIRALKASFKEVHKIDTPSLSVINELSQMPLLEEARRLC